MTAAPEDMDYVVNAKRFNDPDSMSVGKHHTGFHGAIVHGVFKHTSFASTVKGLMEFLLAHCSEQSGSRTLKIGIYCKRGRHRSVAVAVLCLCEYMGARGGRYKFLSKDAGHWQHLCVSCDKCSFTSNAKQTKDGSTSLI